MDGWIMDVFKNYYWTNLCPPEIINSSVLKPDFWSQVKECNYMRLRRISDIAAHCIHFEDMTTTAGLNQLHTLDHKPGARYCIVYLWQTVI